MSKLRCVKLEKLKLGNCSAPSEQWRWVRSRRWLQPVSPRADLKPLFASPLLQGL